MLCLPEVPWKKVAVEELGAGTYGLKVLDAENDDQFDEVVKVVAGCLTEADATIETNIPMRTVLVTTRDYAGFLRNLTFEGVGVEG
jgi:hypothetical protein